MSLPSGKHEAFIRIVSCAPPSCPAPYFADLHAVYRLPVTGGTVETLSYGWGGLRALAVNDTDVYFTDFVGGVVLKVPK